MTRIIFKEERDFSQIITSRELLIDFIENKFTVEKYSFLSNLSAHDWINHLSLRKIIYWSIREKNTGIDSEYLKKIRSRGHLTPEISQNSLLQIIDDPSLKNCSYSIGPIPIYGVAKQLNYIDFLDLYHSITRNAESAESKKIKKCIKATMDAVDNQMLDSDDKNILHKILEKPLRYNEGDLLRSELFFSANMNAPDDEIIRQFSEALKQARKAAQIDPVKKVSPGTLFKKYIDSQLIPYADIKNICDSFDLKIKDSKIAKCLFPDGKDNQDFDRGEKLRKTTKSHHNALLNDDELIESIILSANISLLGSE